VSDAAPPPIHGGALETMKRGKSLAVACLLGGLALALGTPGYLMHRVPHLAGYLGHWGLFVGQAVPYLLCAALWLPWRAPAATTVARGFSCLLLLVALAIYGPMLFHPEWLGGDMGGLAFLLVSAATTTGLVVLSGLAGVWLWVRVRRNGRGSRGKVAT